jgi:hypothetical protein
MLEENALTLFWQVSGWRKGKERIKEKNFLRNIRIYYLEEHNRQLRVIEQNQEDTRSWHHLYSIVEYIQLECHISRNLDHHSHQSLNENNLIKFLNRFSSSDISSVQYLNKMRWLTPNISIVYIQVYIAQQFIFTYTHTLVFNYQVFVW